ncbi:protein kinase [Myxococcus stipitatus]|nr:protein kinase [Myxococcus stipitatus]
MAETWRARWVGDAGVSKSVLIKKVLPQFANDDAFISMFISEARISATLSHGNIAQVFDFGRVDGQYYLAMELVDGQPLHRVLKRAQKTGLQAFPIPLAVYIVLEMCRGLFYAHTRTDDRGQPLGIVHRDISPDNVLISYEGQVKIVDFGIAKARMQRNFSTEPGVVKGKFLYFSPEQARGREVDARTDVWATGLVLYELLCGQMPVEGTQASVMMRMAHGEFPSPREVRKEIPSALNEIVMRALSVSLEGRFESANAFGDSLAAFLYSFAPRFSPMNLAYLIRVLFRGDIAVEGRELAVPQSFIEELALWRTGTAAMPAVKPQGSRKLLPERIELGAEAEEAPTAPSPARGAERPSTTLRELPVVTGGNPPDSWRGGQLLGVGVAVAALLGGAAIIHDIESEPSPSLHALTPVVPAIVDAGGPAEPPAPPSEGARADPSEGVRATPRPPVDRLAIGKMIEEMGRLIRARRYERAVEIGKRCVEQSPAEAECHLLLGSALARNARPEEAYTSYQRFVEFAPPNDPRREMVRGLLRDYDQAHP